MALLEPRTIRLAARYEDKSQAIRDVGRLLVEAGKVEPGYVEKMLEREALVTTYVGNGVAVPHGTKDSLPLIRETGLAVVQIPSGLDFGGGNRVRLLVGIAAQGGEHLDLLTTIASVCSDDDQLEALIAAPDSDTVLRILGGA